MRLDLYHAETARIATEQSALLDVARQRLTEGLMLNPLEQNGVLHALQVLIEAGAPLLQVRAAVGGRPRAGWPA